MKIWKFPQQNLVVYAIESLAQIKSNNCNSFAFVKLSPCVFRGLEQSGASRVYLTKAMLVVAQEKMILFKANACCLKKPKHLLKCYFFHKILNSKL